MRALSIKQPFAELILRGIKTAELRSRPTKILGQRFYIYASKGKLSVDSCQLPVKTWSDDLSVGAPPEWMIELAAQVKLIDPDEELPTGVIVGSAVIEKVEAVAGDRWLVAGADKHSATTVYQPPATSHQPPATMYRWHLTDIKRLARLLKPKGQPQPVWFNPF